MIERRFDLVVFLTGVGVRMMMKAIEPAPGRERFLDALARTRLAARGPKPVAALREVGLTPWVTAPSPNTWRELLATLDAHRDERALRGARVAIQEYGSENPDLVDGLTSRGAAVTTVSIYRWEMPEQLEPLRRAVWSLLRHEIDIVVLTASIQLVHLLRVARTDGTGSQGPQRTASHRHRLDRTDDVRGTGARTACRSTSSRRTPRWDFSSRKWRSSAKPCSGRSDARIPRSRNIRT